ncbi:hypothetical protein CDCA_CDCA08G2439 [Cyanidium caldarium]|uniref:CTLH domain-containing protein n=1 Tax=Cyanidium caldarium TaxID=2771 RepID=A0AAV9IVV1_CYACA|nr:hypothetical protein CDCA_CDCA08G2439 [Cyanidium caldarium]
MELEHCFLRIPAETLYRNLRQHKKLMDRELDGVRALLDELSGWPSSPTRHDELLREVRQRQQSLQQLRLRMDELERDGVEQLRNLRCRATLLSRSGGSGDGDELTDWGAAGGSEDRPSSRRRTMAGDGGDSTPIDGYGSDDEAAGTEDTSTEVETAAHSPPPTATEATARLPPALCEPCELPSTASGSPALRLERFVVDFLLRQGHWDTAKTAIDHWNLHRLTEPHLFEAIQPVVSALRAHRCTEALQYCLENRRRLVKIDSTLEFHLRMQEFIELCREGNTNASLIYAKKHFVSLVARVPAADAPTREHEVYRAVVRCLPLMAFPPDTPCDRYRVLYNVQMWARLEEEFLQTHFALNMLPSEPQLDLLLQPGLCALKTRYCGQAEGGEGEAERVQPNVSADATAAAEVSTATEATEALVQHVASPRHACPTCNSPYRELAAHLPFSHHVRTTAVCRLTGKAMDEHNPPVVLPNGNIYSLEAVNALECTTASGVEVRDPVSGEKFRRELCRRAFIM